MRKHLLLILIFFVCGCSAKPHIVKNSEPFSDVGSNTVFVVNHGWHTGFIVPAKDIFTRIPELKNRFRYSKYIEFGWGDKGFYQAQEITSVLTIKAILWPTESVIHAVSIPQDPFINSRNSDIEELNLTDRNFSSLISFIANSFFKNNKGEVQILKDGIYGDSQFYKGIGDYYLMNTCNKWTAKGLRSAEVDISPTLILTANDVMGYVRKPSDP